MKSYMHVILWLGVVVLLHSSPLRAQEEDLDFTELDKVEKEEFGEQEIKGDDSADFDLENPKGDSAASGGDELDELESELDKADGKPAEGSETVDLEKELEGEPEPAPEQAAEPQPAPEPTPEPLPTLEAPQQAEQPEPAPAPQEETQQAAAPAPEEPITDEPDSKLEARISRIYQKFMTAKTTDEEWAQIAGEKASETYSVQPGDTLWDISVTFFGNGFFWPKLWQLNDDITNPHVITPGKVLKFSPGSLSQAPQMEVQNEGEAAAEQMAEAPEAGATEEAAPEAGAQETAQAEPAEAGPEIPPAKPSRPVLKEIPPSFPFYSATGGDEYDEAGFAISRASEAAPDPAMPLYSFLSESEPTSEGEIIGVEEMGANHAGNWQYVYVRLSGARPGETVTAYRVGEKVEYKSEKYGFQVDYLGALQVIGPVENGIYRAMVTGALELIPKGAKLTRESIPRAVVDKNGRSNGAKGAVVGGHFDTQRRYLGTGQVVYLDIGSGQGVSPGDVMPVLKNELARDSDSLVRQPVREIGTIKIAKTTSKRATGFVVESREAIVPGDVVGGTAQFSGTDEVPAPADDAVSEPDDLEDSLDGELQ